MHCYSFYAHELITVKRLLSLSVLALVLAAFTAPTALAWHSFGFKLIFTDLCLSSALH